MPRFNRTGPSGAGPMTGRQMGVCNENQIGGNKSRIGRNAGYGFGPWGKNHRGRGMRNRWNSANDTTFHTDFEDEIKLENKVRYLKNRLLRAEKELEKFKTENKGD